MDKETQARKLVNLTGEKIAELFGPLKEYLDGERFPPGSVRLVVMPDDTYVTEINGGMIFEHWIKILGKQEETKQDPDYWKKELEKCQGSPHYYYTNYLKYMGKTGRQVPVSEEVFNKQFETFINHGLQKAERSAPEPNQGYNYNGGVLVIVGPQGSGKTRTLQEKVMSCRYQYKKISPDLSLVEMTTACLDHFQAPTETILVCDGIAPGKLMNLLYEFDNLKNVIVSFPNNYGKDAALGVMQMTGKRIDVIECVRM